MQSEEKMLPSVLLDELLTQGKGRDAILNAFVKQFGTGNDSRRVSESMNKLIRERADKELALAQIVATVDLVIRRLVAATESVSEPKAQFNLDRLLKFLWAKANFTGVAREFGRQTHAWGSMGASAKDSEEIAEAFSKGSSFDWASSEEDED